MTDNMKKAENNDIFNKAHNTGGIYKILTNNDGMAIGIDCPNDDEFWFHTDLNVDDFYTIHLPMIDKICTAIKSLTAEAEGIE